MTSNYFRIASWYVIVQLDQIGPCILNALKWPSNSTFLSKNGHIFFKSHNTFKKISRLGKINTMPMNLNSIQLYMEATTKSIFFKAEGKKEHFAPFTYQKSNSHIRLYMPFVNTYIYILPT